MARRAKSVYTAKGGWVLEPPPPLLPFPPPPPPPHPFLPLRSTNAAGFAHKNYGKNVQYSQKMFWVHCAVGKSETFDHCGWDAKK